MFKCQQCGTDEPEARVQSYIGGAVLCDDCLFAGMDEPAPAYDAAAKYVATYRPY